MERSTELEDLVRAWFDAASRGDPALVDELVSEDSAARLVGSDMSEWISGGEAISKFLRGEAIGAGGAVTFTPSETEAYQEGSVGWAATKLTIQLPDGHTVAPRWTSVFHREGDGWKFVQTHASIGIGNADIGWEYDQSG